LSGENWIDKLLDKLFIEKIKKKFAQLTIPLTRNCISMWGLNFCALNGAHYVALFAAGPLWPCSIGKFDLN